MQTLSGKVISGLGDFSRWIEELQNFYTKKTGVKLFPGTLNIQLEKPYHLPPDSIRLEKEEYGGAVSVSIAPCEIFGKAAFILRTDKNASGQGVHPITVIEIAAGEKLRDRYHIKDGDIVQVTVRE